MKIYLDNCAYNRPFDDQRHIRIEMETQAKLYIQDLVKDEKLVLVWSYVSTFENDNNPYESKRISILNFSKYAKEIITENETIISDGNRYMADEIEPLDSLHLASAKYAKVDYFITCDDGLLKYDTGEIDIISPVDFVMNWSKGVLK